jgi:iron complex transport system ATP-binding protein
VSARLEATGLCARIADRLLWRDVALQVRAGECCVIVGPNGAGKTTLLAALAGLFVPERGEIAYDGVPLATLSPRQRARMRAWLPQADHDAFPATVVETVLAGRHPHVSRWHWESAPDLAIAEGALRRVGLADMAARDVATLSGGERRRVAIAAVIAQDAPLLLLDEPTAHLDLHHQIGVLDDLIGWTRAEGKAMLVVLHDLHLALRYADRALALGNGEAIAGAATDVLDAPLLSRIFGHPLAVAQAGPLKTLLPQ